MGLRCGLILLLVLPVIQTLSGDEKPDRGIPKYDGVYLQEEVGTPTVFVYVPESGEQQFLVEPDEKGQITGLRREFTMDGVPHRIAIAMRKGRVESVLWDDRPLVPTALTRQEINDIRAAADRAATNRRYAADPTATDEEHLRALYNISTALTEYPFLAVGEEPASLVRYRLRAFDGLQLDLLNAPVEVQVPLVDKQGILRPTLKKDIEGGHTLEVHCSEVHVTKVTWDGKPVLPGSRNCEQYIMPPTSIFAAGVFVDGTSFSFQRRENGQMQVVRLRGKVLHAREKKSEPYYLAEDFTAAEIFEPKGKLITVFNLGLFAAKPPGKGQAKLPKKQAQPAAGKQEPGPAKNMGAIARIWTDASGKFSVQAKLIELRDGRVVLQRSDGKKIEVPVSELSPTDQKYLDNLPELPAER